MKRQLVLEDGTIFQGIGFGAHADAVGEVVFCTGMTGYQEILSDPSYCGQMVTLTYPLIGNYGINREDFESMRPALSALIVSEWCPHPSNFRSEVSIDEYLRHQNVVGISGIDTRQLTRIIRQKGALKAKICSPEINPEEVVQQLKQITLPQQSVARVSTRNAYPIPGSGFRVVVVDFGAKRGILRELSNRNCDVVVVPYDTGAEDILRWNPDGIMLSNGPGDPKELPEALPMIRGVVGKVPLFGICLGHQLFALAHGANTTKLKFGHRGTNQPVKDLRTGKVTITSQNHGYAVEAASIANTELAITHIALNDQTIEGLRHRSLAAFSVQYHPEASPGPHDSQNLFDEFFELMTQFKQEGNTLCQSALISKPSWLSVQAPL